MKHIFNPLPPAPIFERSRRTFYCDKWGIERKHERSACTLLPSHPLFATIPYEPHHARERITRWEVYTITTQTYMPDANTKPMFKGNWTCIGCKTNISELPFKPAPEREREIMCRDCHKGKMGFGKAISQKQMFDGNWKCAKCNNAISRLPFQPSREDNLLCRDCYQR